MNTISKTMTMDAIVAGAGIWGCTVARRLAEAGRRVFEKRTVVGGDVRGKSVATLRLATHYS